MHSRCVLLDSDGSKPMQTPRWGALLQKAEVDLPLPQKRCEIQFRGKDERTSAEPEVQAGAGDTGTFVRLACEKSA